MWSNGTYSTTVLPAFAPFFGIGVLGLLDVTFTGVMTLCFGTLGLFMVPVFGAIENFNLVNIIKKYAYCFLPEDATTFPSASA